MHKEFIRSNNVSNRSTSSNRPRLKEKWFPMTHPSWLPDTSSCCWTELCSVVDQVFRSANLNKTAKAAATDISDPCGALFCDSIWVYINGGLVLLTSNQGVTASVCPLLRATSTWLKYFTNVQGVRWFWEDSHNPPNVWLEGCMRWLRWLQYT